MDRLFQPNCGRSIFALSVQRRINGFRFPIRPTPNDCEIFFVKTLFLHEQSKTSRGGRRFRDENESTGFAIQPVHNRNLAAVRNFEREELAQLLPKSDPLIRFSRMNEQEGRFVDDDKIVGLINHFEA